MSALKNSKSKLLLSLMVNLFFTITLIIFGPFEIFISNSNDFSFTFKDFWYILALVGILYFFVSTFLLTILPEKLSDFLNTIIFTFTLCCYIQAMFLNGQMKVLVGRQIVWSTSAIIINLIIWLCIFIAIFLLKHFLTKNWKTIVQFLSGALTLMQLVALISLLITTPALSEEKNGYLSTKGMFELSKNDNVIVFILDYFDGTRMDAILSQDPDILEPFRGFTYFPNSTSVHSRTYPSITYLLTGNMCYFDSEPLSYINNAFDNSDFIPELYDNHINIGLYTFNQYLGTSIRSKLCNYVPSKLSLNFSNTVKYMLQMVLYRDMPYLAKNHFIYDVNNINNDITNSSQAALQAENIQPEYQNFNDEWFSSCLNENNLTVDDSNGAFRFYHLGSCHLDLTNPLPYGIRSLEIVNDYLDQMRSLGIYENSTIIIMADHGKSGGGETLDLPHKTAVPLLLVKPAGASTEAIKTSDAPVSHTDFIPTVLSSFSLPHDGQTFFEIPENSDRERYYYYSALYTDEEGEIELREYNVTGDARYTENYHFTGNTWDIQYSDNKVAPK